jgi:hypothetical protein
MTDLNHKNNDTAIWVNSTKNFRRLVGINGMLLPVLLWAFLYYTSGHAEVLESISHYYYTRANTIFIGVMSVLSMFLIVYNAEKRIDFIISFIAGIAAILVILYPTDNLVLTPCLLEGSHVISYTEPHVFRENFHLISAAIFFLALAYMSFFLFTKTDKLEGQLGRKKIIRNRIYRVCAVLMVLSMLVILLFGKYDLMPNLPYDEWKLTFWMEVLAVESFGFSWLVKGEAIFSD